MAATGWLPLQGSTPLLCTASACVRKSACLTTQDPTTQDLLAFDPNNLCMMACVPKTCMIVHCLLSILFLAQVAAAGSSPHQQHSAPELPGEPYPHAEALISFLRQHGSQISVAVRAIPGKGRAAVAPRDFKEGEVFARVPLELTLVTNRSSEQVAAHKLLIAMAQQDHPLRPYFRVLPGPTEVLNSANMPTSYLPIIQDQSTEKAVLQQQQRAEDEWNKYSKAYWRAVGPGITVRNITHAMALLQTRFFWKNPSRLVPLIDFAIHYSACKHTVQVESCPATPVTSSRVDLPEVPKRSADTTTEQVDGTSKCYDAVWVAGEAVRAGQEVCVSYKALMPQDIAMLEYGFLQDGPIALELNAMDRPERKHDGLSIWDFRLQARPSDVTLPAIFEGIPEKVQTRMRFLQRRLDRLHAGEAKVAAVEVDKAVDPDGSLLALLLKWRQQRMQAIRLELQRLQGVLDGSSPQSQQAVATS